MSISFQVLVRFDDWRMQRPLGSFCGDQWVHLLNEQYEFFATDASEYVVCTNMMF